MALAALAGVVVDRRRVAALAVCQAGVTELYLISTRSCPDGTGCTDRRSDWPAPCGSSGSQLGRHG